MSKRDQFIQDFRGTALGSITPESTSEEVFQNQVLRPILKLQNDLFIASFENYITKNKPDFHNLSLERKLLLVDNSIQKDIKFRNALKGMVIALFTLEEYQLYIKNSSNLNKRMMNMLIERIKSQIQLFEKVH